jgi:hypothetical protein
MAPLRIVTCPQWGARPPRQGITTVGQARLIVFHHTASHHREIAPPPSDDPAEAMQYARDIQAFHMDVNGWIDSGHNFLATRAGHVLQGRWLTLSAIEARHMVRSAHCPGENDEIGIEHEHLGTEAPTRAQLEASAQLQAWIAQRYGLAAPLPVYPHRQFVPTECPGNLAAAIPGVHRRAQEILSRLQDPRA